MPSCPQQPQGQHISWSPWYRIAAMAGRFPLHHRAPVLKDSMHFPGIVILDLVASCKPASHPEYHVCLFFNAMSLLQDFLSRGWAEQGTPFFKGNAQLVLVFGRWRAEKNPNSTGSQSPINHGSHAGSSRCMRERVRERARERERGEKAAEVSDRVWLLLHSIPIPFCSYILDQPPCWRQPRFSENIQQDGSACSMYWSRVCG